MKDKPVLPFYVDFPKLSKSLFVLSQKALKRKVKIYELQQSINQTRDETPQVDLREQTSQLIKLKKKQSDFYEKRTAILRFLINKKATKVYGYVQIKDNFYANLRLVSYDFYVIINKKMIKDLGLKYLGDELKYTKDLPLNDVMKIIDSKVAFSYITSVSKDVKKALANEIQLENQAYIESKNAVLAKTVSNTGNIVVIKRKKPTV